MIVVSTWPTSTLYTSHRGSKYSEKGGEANGNFVVVGFG